MPLTGMMVTSEILMCGLKSGLRQIPIVGAGFDAAIGLVEGIKKRHEALAHADRLAGLESQVSRVERGLRDAVENEIRTILANLGRPDLSGSELTQEMREFLQIQQQGWSPHLFDGLLRNSSHWQELRRNPNAYGDVLGDHDPVDPDKGFHLLLDADRTRVLRLKAPALAYLLANQPVGVPAAEVRSSADVWAFPSQGTASVPLVTPAPPVARKAQIVVPGEPAGVITNSIGMALKLIPAGEFEMGSSRFDMAASSGEKPRHKVRITRPFLLGVYPVTQEEYQKVIGSNPSHFRGSGRLPVEWVSWLEAAAFCNMLSQKEGLMPYYSISGDQVTIPDFRGPGYRLPTEAEWEYACRAGSTTRYPSGDASARLDGHAWFDKNSGGETQTVGGKAPNAFGLHDMLGNVWEWCWDGYGETYYKGLRSPVDDPFGPTGGSNRVIRGGGWNIAAGDCRAAFRNGSTPTRMSSYLGFRLARDPSGG